MGEPRVGLLPPCRQPRAPCQPPGNSPPPCPRPRTPCHTPLGLSAPAPAMQQQGHSPAPHSPALPQAPLSWAHLQALIPAWPQSIPVPKEVSDAWGWGFPGVALLPCSWLEGGMGPGCQALPRQTGLSWGIPQCRRHLGSSRPTQHLDAYTKKSLLIYCYQLTCIFKEKKKHWNCWNSRNC